jgi:hypothetical protein
LLHQLCGCRAADGERLDGSSFRITAPQKEAGVEIPAKLRIFFRVTTNRRRKAESYTITTTPKRWIKEISLLMDEGAITKLLGCDAFNKQLRVHLRNKGILQDERGRAISSYSLRHEISYKGLIKSHTTGDTTEWLAVAKMSGHHGSHHTKGNFDRTL